MVRKICKRCRRSIYVARTAATGARMPLDESPERGNVLVDAFGKAHVFANHEAARKAQEVGDWSFDTYIAHMAAGQCPARTEDDTVEDDTPAPPEPVQDQIPF